MNRVLTPKQVGRVDKLVDELERLAFDLPDGPTKKHLREAAHQLGLANAEQIDHEALIAAFG